MAATIAAARGGKSFFLHRLLRDVVFAERGLGIVDPAAERRRRIVRAAVAAGTVEMPGVSPQEAAWLDDGRAGRIPRWGWPRRVGDR